MSFSIGQWAAVIVLDLLFRVAYTIAVTLNPLLIPIMLEYSVMHLLSLIPISCALTAVGVRTRYAAPIALVIANSLFCLLFALTWILSIKRGHQSSCVGFNDRCDWIDGVIMEAGVQFLKREAFIQVVINLIPILIVWLFKDATKTDV